MSSEKDIERLRKSIEYIDADLIKILENRAYYAKQIKLIRGIRDKERENLIRLKIAFLYKGEYPLQTIEDIFEVLFNASEKL
jgi:chorismate mutase